jgi:hypothetical protein
MATLSTVNNQQEILELAKSNKLIFLEPVPPLKGGGNIEHYYHFIFDLSLPLYFLVNKTPPDVIFAFKAFGIYTDRLQHLFPNRIRIEDDGNIPKKTKRMYLIGMDPNCVHLRKSALESFKRYVCNNLEVDQRGRPNKILLIERISPDPYFITSATIKGGGTLRRSIHNHEEVASTLRSMVRAPFEFHNLQLEKIPLQEQVQYFDRAIIVFGQHGAGLANCIWMRSKSMVIELSNNKSLKNFRIISRLKKQHYFLYNTWGSHTSIDNDHFANWILDDAKLRGFFCNPLNSQ